MRATTRSAVVPRRKQKSGFHYSSDIEGRWKGTNLKSPYLFIVWGSLSRERVRARNTHVAKVAGLCTRATVTSTVCACAHLYKPRRNYNNTQWNTWANRQHGRLSSTLVTKTSLGNNKYINYVLIVRVSCIYYFETFLALFCDSCFTLNLVN